MDQQPETRGRLEPAHSLVVYDAETGQILRIHHFAAMPGAELPPRAQLHEMTLKQAAAGLGREMAGMKVLDIDAKAMKRKASYRVSTSDGVLVEIPAAAREV